MFEDYTTNKKEEIAKAVMEAFYKDWMDENHIDDKSAVINVLREVCPRNL